MVEKILEGIKSIMDTPPSKSTPGASTSLVSKGKAKVTPSSYNMPSGTIFCTICGEYDNLASHCNLLNNVSYVDHDDECSENDFEQVNALSSDMRRRMEHGPRFGGLIMVKGIWVLIIFMATVWELTSITRGLLGGTGISLLQMPMVMGVKTHTNKGIMVIKTKVLATITLLMEAKGNLGEISTPIMVGTTGTWGGILINSPLMHHTTPSRFQQPNCLCESRTIQ